MVVSAVQPDRLKYGTRYILKFPESSKTEITIVKVWQSEKGFASDCLMREMAFCDSDEVPGGGIITKYESRIL